MTHTILFIDHDEPSLRALTRFRSVFSLRFGIYTEAERARILHPGSQIVYFHEDPRYEKLFSEIEGYTPYRETPWSNEDPDSAGTRGFESGDIVLVRRSEEFNPFFLLDDLEKTIRRDLKTARSHDPRLRSLPEWEGWKANSDNDAPGPVSLEHLQIVGPREELYLNAGTRILPGSVVDTRKGPVVLDANTEISPFSYLEGPLYIGCNSRIDDARITGGCLLGHSVRVGGEVENSILNDFTNKHHEGFVGHCIVGSWVNLGALTTTSDLKNNYGEIRLSVPGNLREATPDRAREGTRETHAGPGLHTIPTGRIKFGSLIGDHVKTAIGTMVNTGSVLDAGSSLFGKNPGKYAPPFTWGAPPQIYEKERFLSDASRIMARRGEKIHPRFRDLVELLHGPG